MSTIHIEVVVADDADEPRSDRALHQDVAEVILNANWADADLSLVHYTVTNAAGARIAHYMLGKEE